MAVRVERHAAMHFVLVDHLQKVAFIYYIGGRPENELPPKENKQNPLQPSPHEH